MMSPPSDEHVHIELNDGCAWVTLDRPPLNLLTPDFNEAIRKTFVALAHDGAVRVAVITGAGRHMTGGMQIEAMRDLTPESAASLITGLHDAIAAVHEAPFVTIAMVNGACLGAGFELAIACDLRVAASDARLGLPEVRVGIPSVIHAALLPGLIGPGRAAELLLTGGSIAAETALAWGLVNRVATPEALRSSTEALVTELLQCGPRALKLQKELIIRWRTTDQRTAIHAGIEAFSRAYQSDEPRDAMQAFLEKRLK